MDNQNKTPPIVQHGTQKWSRGASKNDLYRPRRPENSGYYQCVEDHFEDFEQVYEERFERAYGFYRPYLWSVIYRYLDCGILRNGFARVRCGECGHEYLLAFSCKRRHFCPSCHQKRVVEFDLDFHTVPFHGEEALMEKHYVSKRSRRQKGILAFWAQDAEKRVFCYANGQLRKDQQDEEVLRFVEFWKQRAGKLPEELIFDSRLTTYGHLSRLNQMGIAFITLRRRSAKMLQKIYQEPISAWRRIELQGVSRIYKTPRILDRQIQLRDYQGALREIIIEELGHEEPTFLITNQLRRTPAKLIERYAQRMIIENRIADGIDFFHMDALSSVVAMKVNCDLQLTLMASSLYRLLGTEVGQGYQTALSRHLFRDFVEATAQVQILEKDIVVQFQKRAHNPLLLAVGFDKKNVPIPWLGGKRLQLLFG